MTIVVCGGVDGNRELGVRSVRMGKVVVVVIVIMWAKGKGGGFLLLLYHTYRWKKEKVLGVVLVDVKIPK